MYLVLFSIVLYRTKLYYTDNIFLYNYLWQMHQIIHLSPVGCFTPARGKTVQTNREESRVKVLVVFISSVLVYCNTSLYFVFTILQTSAFQTQRNNISQWQFK